MTSKTIEELLEEYDPEGKYVYTREQYETDRVRITQRICEKHKISEAEITALIREHRYEHSEEDIEDEWIQMMTFARVAGWI